MKTSHRNWLATMTTGLALLSLAACAADSAPEQPGSAQSIRATFTEHRSEIKACYDQALAATPGLAGEVALRLRIEPSGEVSQVDVQQSDVNAPALERCLVDRVKRWTFPRPGRVLQVTYPFRFRPGPAKGPRSGSQG